MLEVGISSESGLLSPYLRKKLNPLRFTLVTAKNIPNKRDPSYRPVHAKVEFVDQSSFTTQEIPQ